MMPTKPNKTMKTNKTTIRFQNREIEATIIKADEAIDIHKLHHRSRAEFTEYVAPFVGATEEDTLFTFRQRAVLVLHRGAGRVMLSGQWQQGGVFNPLVAYCDVQGVSKDFFLIEDEGLSGVERDHRNSLTSHVPDYHKLYVSLALQCFLDGQDPLSSGSALDIAHSFGHRHKHLVAHEGDAVHRRYIDNYYQTWRSLVATPPSVEVVTRDLERNTLSKLLRSTMETTRAAQRNTFLNKLVYGDTDMKPNYKITSWDDNGRIGFSSGITQTLDRGEARAFLEGAKASIRTSYGTIQRQGNVLVCGCHRVSVDEARNLLGLPPVETNKDDDLPPHLVKLKATYGAIKVEGEDVIAALGAEVDKAVTAVRDAEDGGEADESTIETLHTAVSVARSNLFHDSSDIKAKRATSIRDLRTKIGDAYRKTEAKIKAKLEASDTLKEAVEANRASLILDHEKQLADTAHAKRAQERLQNHRRWLDYVALNVHGDIITTK